MGIYMGLDARKPVFGGLRTTKAQTSLRICAVWSGPLIFAFYTPPLKCGEVLCYTLRCLSVRPSVRPCSPFPIDNLSIYSRNFFKFCIHIVIGDEWYGIVNGQNPSIFNGVTALFRIGKMVSGLLFLYYSWYLNETSQICCTSKVTYCD